MSDGALSQAEIDALLSGVDSSASQGGVPQGGAEDDASILEQFFQGAAEPESVSLAAAVGGSASLRNPTVRFVNRDALLPELPDKVTAVKADFSAGFPGEHSFLLPEAGAKAVASAMTKEADITLDEMAISVIGEVLNGIVNAEAEALSDKTGSKGIASAPPEGANVPKAAAALPEGDFAVVHWELDLGDGTAHEVWEVLGPQVAHGIAAGIRQKSAAAQGAAPGAAGLGAAGLGAGGFGAGGFGAGAGFGGGGGYGGSPSVQPVQFPPLNPRAVSQEQGNINLLLDVFMEMTVELGRTRRLIKEILSMGEGTIIELDKLAGEPVDILVNHKPIAKGEVVVIDENFGVRVTEIVSPMERVNDLG
ncbi:MAG: flagellar motor switch protein FliN [Treponema sp.]|jgi:flagellar motor switch protein FliN/FliY|nr:flagellar motor switch protein FliN [Treponema sp.]